MEVIIYFIQQNSTNKDLTDWGQRLILFMLKRGAPYESLEEPERSALHVALNVGIRTGRLPRQGSVMCSCIVASPPESFDGIWVCIF